MSVKQGKAPGSGSKQATAKAQPLPKFPPDIYAQEGHRLPPELVEHEERWEAIRQAHNAARQARGLPQLPKFPRPIYIKEGGRLPWETPWWERLAAWWRGRGAGGRGLAKRPRA